MRIIEKLEHCSFEKYQEREQLILELLESSELDSDSSIGVRFLDILKDSIDDPSQSTLYKKGINKLLDIQRAFPKEKLVSWQEVTDTAIWAIIYKYTYTEEFDKNELLALVELGEDLLDSYPKNHDDSYWISTIKVHSNHLAEYGRAHQDRHALKSSLEYNEEALKLYKNGFSPDYWQLDYMVALTKVNRIDLILDSFELNAELFRGEFNCLEALFEDVLEITLDQGADWEISRLEDLQRKYSKLKRENLD